MSFDKNLEKYIFNACIGPDVEEKSRRNFEESCDFGRDLQKKKITHNKLIKTTITCGQPQLKRW